MSRLFITNSLSTKKMYDNKIGNPVLLLHIRVITITHNLILTMKKILFLLACNLAIFTYAFAATVTWDGGGGDTDWMNALNWDTDMIPTSADDVDIEDATVVLSNSTTVQRIDLFGSADLTIDAGVTLTIDGFTGNDDGFDVNNSAAVTNDGTLNISNIVGGSAADGLYVRGTFMNNGIVTINNIGQHGLFVQRGNFTNNTGATITVTDAGQANSDGDNLYVDDSSGALGLLTNNGTINLNKTNTTGDDAIYVNDNSTFDNNGTVTILVIGGSGNNAIRLDDGGIFNNNMGATFSADGGTDDQILVDNSNAVFNNFGTIDLDNVDGDDGGLYIIDGGEFNNEATGVITIDGGDGFGILMDANANATPATLNNAGSITVQNIGDDGVRMRDDAVLNNLSGGTLTLNTSGDEGIDFSNATGETGVNSSLTNAGTIIINGSNGHGIDIVVGSVTNNGMISILDYGVDTNDDGIRVRGGALTNNTGAMLAINGDGNADDGIELDNPSIINNSGTISITNADDHGIDIQGTFNNMAGSLFQATMSTDDGIRMQGGMFNNDGGISIDNSGSNDIETDNHPFNNTANATFAPGSSPGDLDLEDDIDLGTSTTTFEITGTTPVTQYDQIIHGNSSNTLTISNAKATLDWGSFVPVVNDVFTIVDGSNDIAGEFATVTSSNPSIVFTVDYTSNVNEVRIVIEEILPVELTHFIGAKSDQGAKLSWQTATEINNEGFDVERSSDNKRWTKIGYVNGNGNTNDAIQYAFLDNAPTAEINYYRLKQNDFDGNFEYSNVVALDFRNNKGEISIYPNPVEDVLNIDLNQELENVEIQLLDANGKILWIQQEVVSQIPFGDYIPGVYFLKVKSSAGLTVQRIIHN